MNSDRVAGLGHRSRKVRMGWMMWWAAVLLLCLSPVISWARGGGGCLAEGTRVLTPEGAVAIEKLKKGDSVWSVTEGRLRRAEVQVLATVDPEEYLEISTSGARLVVTPEHLMMVAPGEYQAADQLGPGDRVYLAGNGKFDPVRVQSVRRVVAGRPAYNLLVSPGGTFVTEGLVVHNKGCFLPDSQILNADGTEAKISAVKPGDELLAFKLDGRMVRTKVREVFRLKVEEYFLLKTEQTTLRVTAEHPFYVGHGTFKTVEALREGDTVFAWDGQWLAEQRVVSLQKIHDRVDVFNLQTDHPSTFFAGHLAVHNKGGGGGCFPSGTKIATPNGMVAIETLTSGDQVFGVNNEGRTVRTTVKVLFISKSPVMRVKTSGEVFGVTEDHPVSIEAGRFRQAGELRPGDHILKWKEGRLVAKKVRAVSSPAGDELVFNLQVEDPNTFIAEGMVVHNKGGGCFPGGTRIRTPKGEIDIKKLSPGDPVMAVDSNGRIIEARVEKIFDTRSLVLTVDTDQGRLRATPDHPIGLPDGEFIPACRLRPGQKILAWRDGGVRSATVLRTRMDEKEEPVYNLSVGSPNTFLAANFVSHNKGGSSSSSHSSSSSSGGGSSGDWVMYVVLSMFIMVFGLIFVGVILSLLKGKGRSKSENLDFVYDRSKVSSKAGKTEKLLIFLGQQDPSVKPEGLRNLVDSTFRKLQECWQARKYEPMKSLMMPDLFNQHLAQLNRMITNHETNKIDKIKVDYIDLVNIRYTEKPDQREFTALITASAQDYYVDDATGKFLRGDKTPARFQEFWTFHNVGGQWLLREIEQSGESDMLKEANFAEMLTDDTIKGIYGEVAKRKGEAGPWLEKETEEKATRIDRMLNFLVQTDKLWDRSGMLERARQVFMGVYLARESGDLNQVPALDLFPAVAENVRNQIKRWQSEGIRVEYRNICVRKAELILVRNFADNSKDEYTVRISAHAQRIIRKGEDVQSEQEYVTPFEEYWTFGRLDKQWKLKEVVPSSVGKKKITMENVDEESSAGQMQWYYRQPRAK
jgi:predicted lipid-binding transport protein (Tim44 family)/3-dehydroquinate synthase class II